MGYLSQFYAVQSLFYLLSLVSLSISGWIVQRVGTAFFYVSSKRRNIAIANLTIAYGDKLSIAKKMEIARKCFENGALSILELFLIKKIKRNSPSRFTMTGKRYFEEAFSRGKGAVFVASHLGSWEYIGFAGYLSQISHSVIVKDVRNKYLNRTIDRLRRTIDTLPIPKINAIRQTLTELRKNHGVGVLIDQWDGRDGIWGNFFGTATSTTSLPARLAKKTGCALIPIYCLRKKIGQYEIQVMPEVQLSEGPDWEIRTTQHLNEILESQIRRYPEQWSWGHRRWKPKPLTTRLA